MSTQLYIWRDDRWNYADSSYLPEIIAEEGVVSDRAPGFPSKSPDGRPTDGKNGLLYRVINAGSWAGLPPIVQAMYRPIRLAGDAGRISYEILPPASVGDGKLIDNQYGSQP